MSFRNRRAAPARDHPAEPCQTGGAPESVLVPPVLTVSSVPVSAGSEAGGVSSSGGSSVGPVVTGSDVPCCESGGGGHSSGTGTVTQSRVGSVVTPPVGSSTGSVGPPPPGFPVLVG